MIRDLGKKEQLHAPILSTESTAFLQYSCDRISAPTLSTNSRQGYLQDSSCVKCVKGKLESFSGGNQKFKWLRLRKAFENEE